MLQLGDALGQKFAGAGVGFILLFKIGAYEGVRYCIRDLGGGLGVAMLKCDVDQPRLFVVTRATLTHGLDFKPALQCPDEWREALGLG